MAAKSSGNGHLYGELIQKAKRNSVRNFTLLSQMMMGSIFNAIKRRLLA